MNGDEIEELKRIIAQERENGNDYILFAETDRDDLDFWRDVIENFAPNQSIKYKSFNSGRKTSEGTNPIRKFLAQCDEKFLHQNPVIFCIDSDENYLLQDPLTQNKKYIFQTYTHSIENHKANPKSLNRIAKRFESDFDFIIFFQEYSRVIYEVLLYWIAIKKIKREMIKNQESIPEDKFKSSENLKCIQINSGNKLDLSNNGINEIIKIQAQIDKWIGEVRQAFPEIDIEVVRQNITTSNLIIAPEDSYLYIRGHNLLGTLEKKKADGVVLAIIKKIHDNYVKLREGEFNIDSSQREYKRKELENYLERNNFVTLLNTAYRDCFLPNNSCTLMMKIGEDIQRYFAEKSGNNDV